MGNLKLAFQLPICNDLGMNTTEFHTPGQLLAQLLDERAWSQRLLSVILGITEATISKIIAGNLAVSAELALQFEFVFDVPAEDFVRLQREYELKRARLIARQPDAGEAIRAGLFGKLPISETIKRGWLDAKDVRDVKKVEASLLRFFGVKSLGEIETLPHAAKKTEVMGNVTEAQLMWIYRVKRVADDLMVARYSEASVQDAIRKLEPLMMSQESARKVPHILAQAGIRFVLVEALSSTKIDGVCLWLNESSPVIGMTLRYDRIDNFWFVLRHELEHVALKHGQAAIMLDTELEGERAGSGATVSEEERAANEAAANYGFSQSYLQKFIDRKAPFFRELDVLGFARTVQVHPGIVVGRLQHATGRYDLLRKHLVKIRSKVAASAMVDGWGEVAPVEY